MSSIRSYHTYELSFHCTYWIVLCVIAAYSAPLLWHYKDTIVESLLPVRYVASFTWHSRSTCDHLNLSLGSLYCKKYNSATRLSSRSSEELVKEREKKAYLSSVLLLQNDTFVNPNQRQRKKKSTNKNKSQQHRDLLLGKRRSQEMISNLKKYKDDIPEALRLFYQMYPQLSIHNNEKQDVHATDNEKVGQMIDGKVVSAMIQILAAKEQSNLLDAITLMNQIINYCNPQAQKKENKVLLLSAYKSFITYVCRFAGPCWVWHTILYHLPTVTATNNNEIYQNVELHHAMLSALGSRLDLIQLLNEWKLDSEKIPIQLWTELFSQEEIDHFKTNMNVNDIPIQNNLSTQANTSSWMNLPPVDKMSLKISITSIARHVSKYEDEDVHVAAMLVCAYLKQLQQEYPTTDLISTYHFVIKIISKAAGIQRNLNNNEYDYIKIAMDLWHEMPESHRYNHGTIDLMKSLCTKESAWDKISLLMPDEEKENGKNGNNINEQIYWYTTQDLGQNLPKIVLPNESFFELGRWTRDINGKNQTVLIGIKPHRNPIQNGLTFVFYLDHQENNGISTPEEECEKEINEWEGTRKQRSKLSEDSTKYEKIAFILVRHKAEKEGISLKQKNDNNIEIETSEYNSPKHNQLLSSLFMGMWIDPKFRGDSWATIFMAVWIQSCHKAGVSCIATEKINKPILALLLTKFGFTPKSGGIDMEISPVKHLSSTHDIESCPLEAQCVLYSSQNVLLNGAFTARDLRLQNIFIAQSAPFPRGTKIALKTSFLFNSSTTDRTEYKDFINRVHTNFEKTCQPIRWSTTSDMIFQRALFGYLL